MQRRKFLATVGSLAAGSAAAIGTGAFTSVDAERLVTINMADDAAALLALEPTEGPNADYTVVNEDGTLGIDVSGENPTGPDGTGVNKDAVTDIDNIFRVSNQGTQPVWLWFRITNGGFKTEYYFYDSEDGVPLSLPKSAESLSGKTIEAVYLGVGESVDIGMSIDSYDQFGEKNNSVMIHAAANETEVPGNIGAEAKPT